MNVRAATKLCAIAALFAVLAVTGARAQDADGVETVVYDVPAQTPEQCSDSIQNSTTDMLIAFSGCLASNSASTACCSAVESTFAFSNEKFGGCLCHPILMNTVMQLADAFLPGASTLIPEVMDNCTRDYASEFAYFGQTHGTSMCDPSTLVDVDAVDETILAAYLPAAEGDEPNVNAQSRDDSQASAEDAGSSSSASMNDALTVFSVLTVEQCGVNLLGGQDQLIGALTPCILAESATQTCCSAIENVFRADNQDFGKCLCHKEVMDGIFAQAEGFLPGSTALIEDAFHTCTNDFGSHFSYHGQQIGHVSCSGEALKAPSMSQAGKTDGTDDHPLSFIEETFGAPGGANSAAASTTSAAFVSALVSAVAFSYAVLL